MFKVVRRSCTLIVRGIALFGVMLAVPAYGSDSDVSVDPSALKRHVRMLSEDFSPRSATDTENLEKTAAYIARHLEGTGAAVNFQAYEADGHTYRNVVARYGPDSEQITVVGAHYDAYSSLPGADDNASGVAGLLELGRLLGRQPPDQRIELVAFTLEEPPYYATDKMGSVVHAQAHKAAGTQIKLMIALEMIGYFTDAPNSQGFPLGVLQHFYPDQGNFIAVVDQLISSKGLAVKAAINRHTELSAHALNAPSIVTGIDFSDHRSFWAAGYPAIMITDTAFFRNKAYHTPQDTFDRLDYAKMAAVVFGVFKYLTTPE
jgi:Zn-dependent M28 family amino/carboxypeptidase